MESRQAGPGCIIYGGPAALPPSLTVDNPPTSVNLWMLGVRPTNGTIRLTADVASPDGKTVAPGEPSVHKIPGYQIMLGALWAYLGGKFPPVSAAALQGFSRIWPVQDEPVTIRAASLDTRAAHAA